MRRSELAVTPPYSTPEGHLQPLATPDIAVALRRLRRPQPLCMELLSMSSFDTRCAWAQAACACAALLMHCSTTRGCRSPSMQQDHCRSRHQCSLAGAQAVCAASGSKTTWGREAPVLTVCDAGNNTCRPHEVRRRSAKTGLYWQYLSPHPTPRLAMWHKRCLCRLPMLCLKQTQPHPHSQTVCAVAYVTATHVQLQGCTVLNTVWHTTAWHKPYAAQQ
jgi:hypothetical protein